MQQSDGMMPDVSVIVVTRNQETTIGRTLDSILAQRCPFPFEIVIGEDASTDSTRNICEEYAMRYPLTVRLMPAYSRQMGVVSNYFACLDSCRGRYIADCAGDDYWIGSNRLELQHSVLEDNPRVSVVHSGWTRNEHHTATRFTPAIHALRITPGRRMMDAVTAGEMLHLSTALYRKEYVMEALRRSPQLICRPDWGMEDLPVVMCLCAQGDVAYIDDITLCYTLSPDSISGATDSLRHLHYALSVIRARHELGISYGVDMRTLSEALSHRLAYALALAVRLGDSDAGNTTISLARSLGIGLTKKARIYRAILGNEWLLKIYLTCSCLLSKRVR